MYRKIQKETKVTSKDNKRRPS